MGTFKYQARDVSEIAEVGQRRPGILIKQPSNVATGQIHCPIFTCSVPAAGSVYKNDPD